MSCTCTLEKKLELKQQELRPFFKPGFLHRAHTVYQFEFPADAPFHLVVTDSDFSMNPGIHEAPTLRLYVEGHETCWGLLQGRLDGMQAFLEGRYRADGHIVLSQLLLYLFKAEDQTSIYEVKD